MGTAVVPTGSPSQSRRASWTWCQAWISFQVCWEPWTALTELTFVKSLSRMRGGERTTVLQDKQGGHGWKLSLEA